MAVYIYTGNLGGGKSLCAVARIKEKIEQGCRVASNIDINLTSMFHKRAKDIDFVRVPDKPLIHDLNMIGKGNESYDESENGLLVLDECGTWFNSRNWNDKTRKAVNDWFLHARKLGWDVILIIQDISILDSQARAAIAEHTAFCRRLDRVQVPFIGTLYKAITGYRLAGPRIHLAKVVYGTSPNDLLADRHTYRGTDLYSSYDTKQQFTDSYPHGVHSLLTPWHLSRNSFTNRNKEFFMRLTKIYWRQFKAPLALGVGSFFGIVLALVLQPFIVSQVSSEPKIVYVDKPELIQKSEPDITEPEKSPGQLSDDSADTVKSRFSAFRIVSYMEAKEVSHYLLSDGETTYTVDQVRALGMRVDPVNNCHLMITSALDSSDRAQIFAADCMPRRYDEKAYDISSVPMIANRETVRTEPVQQRGYRVSLGDGSYWSRN